MEVLNEIFYHYDAKLPSSSLIISGNLYKLCAYILELNQNSQLLGNSKTIACIEKALEIIYHKYNTPLTVDTVAKETGYGTSNFCKVFKNTTGISFHKFLNNFRIQTACYILTETDYNIGKVGELVGLSEFKTFCRIFKEIAGTPPGQYRKKTQILTDE